VPSSEPLVHVLRGGILESVHAGALVVVEDDVVTFHRGDPERPVFYRSASKPLQALEVVLSGAADAFDLSAAELAIAAGSHNGESRHLATVRSILAKSGVAEDALRCGGHRSVVPDVAFEQRRSGVPVTPILSNCSGKHAGMLAAARRRGLPLDGYMDLAHPVQRSILAHVAAFAGIPEEEVLAGVDGCGAPALVVPLAAMARSIARFAAATAVAEPLAGAAARVARAMMDHPEMVAGDERFDTDLMRAAPGRLLAKAGAEGVHVVAVPERRVGMAVKVDDGSDRGYRAIVIEFLRHRGVIAAEAADALRSKHAAPTIRSIAGREAGALRPAFTF
jgi:L-asparaginase II